jgi:hypothetical protein
MNLSLNEWLLIASASWIILACVVAVPIGRAMNKAEAVEAAEEVNWLPFLPPVPLPDSQWLDAWPTDASDTGEMRLRFDQIVAAEGWAA